MKLRYEYSNEIIEFEIIYRNRKTMCIKIEESGDVKVIVPFESKNNDILRAIIPKSSWIINKKNEVLNKLKNKARRELINGNTFMFLGEEFPLNIVLDSSFKETKIEVINKRFRIYTSIEDKSSLKNILELWYKKQTLALIMDSINRYQKYFNTSPTSVKVKEQKRRWASCTNKRVLLFNWRISMAPKEVIDYIVVHEMCHMIHMNHSKEYWFEVERVIPDYKIRKMWLKENEFKMIT